MSDETSRSKRRIGHAAGVGLLLLCVAPFIITGAPAVVGAEQSYVVLTGSMAAEPEPVIRPGDVVVVSGVDPGDIEAGDVITFSRDGGTPTTHRVVEVTTRDGTRVFTTQGDNNEEADPQPVAAADVIGRVQFVLPYVGHVVRFAGTTTGMISLIGVPVVLLVVSEAWRLTQATEDTSHPTVADRTAGRSTGDDNEAAMPQTAEREVTTEVEADAADGESTVRLSRDQLWWVLACLVPLTAGIGVLAYQLRTAVTISAFYAGLGLSLLCGAVYLKMGATAEPTNQGGIPAGSPGGATDARAVNEDESVAPDGRVLKGRVQSDPAAVGRVVVALDSLAALRSLARTRGTRIIHDEAAGAQFVIGQEAIFRVETADQAVAHESEGEPPGPTGETAGAAADASTPTGPSPAVATVDTEADGDGARKDADRTAAPGGSHPVVEGAGEGGEGV